MKRRNVRLTVGSASSEGMPATRLRSPAAANSDAGPIPGTPPRSALATSSRPFPMQETIPIPVTATRRISSYDAAVHADHLARDVARLVRHQEGDGRGDLLGRAGAPHRHR